MSAEVIAAAPVAAAAAVPQPQSAATLTTTTIDEFATIVVDPAPTSVPLQQSIKHTSESEDLSENLPDEATNGFEAADFNKTATSSSHHDSEYDTASDTPSSEADDLNDDDDDDDEFEDDDDDDDEEEEDDDDEELEDDDGSIVLDLERQRGDGEEQDGEKKKVDDDEDRSNPQYIPKRGVFYEHDDRTADEPEAVRNEEEEGGEEKKPTDTATPTPKKPVKKSAAVDRWSHDRFNPNEQAPKSRAELVNSYGYDIRNEDGPPRARRRRRYGSGPNKYTRKWEDEGAYTKMSSAPQQQQRNPRAEDFPELGTRGVASAVKQRGSFREEKENTGDGGDNSRYFQNNRSPVRQPQQRSGGGSGARTPPSTADKYERSTATDRYEGGGNNRYDTKPRHSDHRLEGSKRQQSAPFFDDNNRRSPPQQNERFDRSANERYEGNRTSSRGGGGGGGERYDGGNRERFDDMPNNDRFDRSQNERFDGKRSQPVMGSQSDRFDRDGGGSGDKNWDRRNNRATPSAGFRTKNTIEFKNQNRNKSMDGPQQPQQQQQQHSTQHSSPMTGGNTTQSNKNFGVSGTGFGGRQQFTDYEDEKQHHIESLSFTNTKLGPVTGPTDRYNTSSGGGGGDYDQGRTEMERPERPITGRHQAPQSSRQPTALLPLTNQQQQTLSHQQMLSQPPPTAHQLQQSGGMLTTSDASRATTTKRYSALRQRGNVEVTQPQQQQQQMPTNPLTLHDQQLMLQDATALMLQRQQLQEQLQMQQQQQQQQQQPILAATSNYLGQTMPLQMNDYKQPPQQQQQQQQPPPLLLATPGAVAAQSAPQPNVAVGQPYQSAYYSAPPPSNDYAGSPSVVTAVGPPQQPQQTSVPPSNAQILGASQYPAQYSAQPSQAAYIQPPPQPAYIQQQQQQPPPPPVVAAQQQQQQQQQQQPQPPTNNQQQLMNYVPAMPSAAQAQFQPVPSFPAYPTVPNYNSVSSGITYYAPQTQPPPRPILPQRRPTNAIPILAPPERAGGKARHRNANQQFDEFDDDAKNGSATITAPIGSPENIDHILDNMFVQRAPYQPPSTVRKSNSPAPLDAAGSKADGEPLIVVDCGNAVDIDAAVSKLSLHGVGGLLGKLQEPLIAAPTTNNTALTQTSVFSVAAEGDGVATDTVASS